MKFALTLSACLLATTALAQEFPLTIKHKFGTSVIDAAPERVASIDYAGADDLLALGVQPVTIRHWYGDFPRGVWPWADPLLEGNPVVLKGELDFEAIAAQKPDVIIALWSGIDADAYEKLSLIAPVVAVPENVGDFALPWDERAKIAGRAVGREAETEKKVADINAQLAAVAERHPDWKGKKAAIAFVYTGSLGAYGSDDIRSQLLAQMGLVHPPEVDALVGANGFTAELSREDLSPIDNDLLIWASPDGDFSMVKALEARRFMDIAKTGGEAFAGPMLTSALSHASLLSLPQGIEMLEPMLEAALDGNPETNADDR